MKKFGNDVTELSSSILSYLLTMHLPCSQAPSLDIPPVIPDQGPASGGTLVTVNGRDLGIGSRREVFIRRQACQVVNFTVDTITCVTAASLPVLNNLLEVRIDDWVITGRGYDYLSDPTFESISPMLSFSR